MKIGDRVVTIGGGSYSVPLNLKGVIVDIKARYCYVSQEAGGYNFLVKPEHLKLDEVYYVKQIIEKYEVSERR